MTMESENSISNEPAGEATMESLLKEQASFRQRLDGREIVWVKVVQVKEKGVMVDIGEKHEGVIPVSDFDEAPAAGTKVPAVLVAPGRDERPAQLSHKKAKQTIGWEHAQKAFTDKARVRGKVTSAIKGGFMVDVGGVSAFLPASLADLRPVRKPQAMVGTGVRCVILEVNQSKKQLVLSRKAVLEEEVKKRRDKLVSKLKVGSVMIGRVTHSTPAGVFVNVGGVEGFVPTAELAWKEPEKARQTIAPGQKLRLRVTRIETETGKITLGAKQLLANPADALRKKFPLKTVISGKVSEVLPDGVKVQIADGVIAFAPVAELPSNAVPEARDDRDRDRGRPRDQRTRERDFKTLAAHAIWPKVGDEVKGNVLGINAATFELTVSIRRYEEAQDKKRVAKYLKDPPRLTLGQILSQEE
ncbi:MAG: S1 RNA-binding domain-containing protein [Elusimicrobia bacterium]|nr:S1 RNA-binding domain-containing protein [Elusimicrobiota bacterium]